MEAKYKNAALEKYREEREKRDKKRSNPEPDQDKNDFYPDVSQDTNGSYPSDEPIIRKKKRVTVSEVMSEQQMFQDQVLDLQTKTADLDIIRERLMKTEDQVKTLHSRIRIQGLTMKKMVSVLQSLIQRFDDHVSLDSAGVTDVANTISNLGIPDKPTIWDGDEDIDCNCPDNLDCPVHPDKKKK